MPVSDSNRFKSDLLHFIHEDPQKILSQVIAREMVFKMLLF